MIVEEIQGNIANLNSEKQKHVEKVYLENSDLKHLRKISYRPSALK